MIFILCLGLAACGTKPKHLKSEGQFPQTYPAAETPTTTPAAAAATQNSPATDAAAPAVNPPATK